MSLPNEENDKSSSSDAQEKISDELYKRVKKFLRGAEANLEGLKDKKLKGQLAVREELYGKSAQAAAKAEKWLLPSEGGYLETEGIEKTCRIKQESIALHLSMPPNGFNKISTHNWRSQEA